MGSQQQDAQQQGLQAPDADAPAYAGDGFVAGLGVDIVEIARMEKVLARTPRFATRVFTEDERAYCEQHHKPYVRYAMRFAAKEAVLKALGTGFAQGIGPTDVEVGHDRRGRPVAVLHGKAKQLAERQGILEMHLSLSRTHDTAVANAIAVTQGSRPAREDKPDPRAELAATFKELRGMLDDIEDADAPADKAGEDEQPA